MLESGAQTGRVPIDEEASGGWRMTNLDDGVIEGTNVQTSGRLDRGALGLGVLLGACWAALGGLKVSIKTGVPIPQSADANRKANGLQFYRFIRLPRAQLEHVGSHLDQY